jgi:hypothetical protein
MTGKARHTLWRERHLSGKQSWGSDALPIPTRKNFLAGESGETVTKKDQRSPSSRLAYLIALS